MIGFCFSGDGSRGAIQAGIALSLYKKGIKADFVMGTSSGSACAAAYAFAGPEGLADMWSNVTNITSLFSINWDVLWNRGIFNQKPAEKIVQKIVQQGPFCVGAISRVNIVSGEIQYVKSTDVSREEFAEAALGAVAIPGLVTDRNGWVDAGERQMAPLKQCIEMGCDEIYVILGRPLMTPQWKLPRGLFSMASMAYRAVDLSLYELLVRDIQSCLRHNMCAEMGRANFDDQDGLPKSIKVHVVETKELLYDSILFRNCPKGVKYGLNDGYIIRDEQALRMTMI